MVLAERSRKKLTAADFHATSGAMGMVHSLQVGDDPKMAFFHRMRDSGRSDRIRASV